MRLIKILVPWAVVALVWTLEVVYVVPALENSDFIIPPLISIGSLFLCCALTFVVGVGTLSELDSDAPQKAASTTTSSAEHEQYVQRLEDEVASGGMTAAQRDDMLEQKSLFDQAVDDNRVAHQDRVVGYIGGQKLVAGSVPDLLGEAKKYPGKMLYFEEL